MLIDGDHINAMFFYFFLLFCLNIFSGLLNVNGNECQFLTMCKCTNFPLFALIDTSYLSKPQSSLNQDLFCTHSNDRLYDNKTTTFEQLKYFYYRFRTLTFANYPNIPTKAFHFVHFETQSVKQTHKANNRNVIVFVNVKSTEPGIFEELSVSDSQNQLSISFLNSPSLYYANGALSKISCYELKLFNTNPQIPIDFFYQAVSIHHLIIENPYFSGFLSSSKSKTSFNFQIYKISIKDISVRQLQGKHFPIIFNSVQELTLENYNVNSGFRSFNNRELAHCFPQVKSLKIYSRSIQNIASRMFEHFSQLEYLTITGIIRIENNAFYNLNHLKELNLGENIHHVDPFAFVNMNTNILLLNQSHNFELNDDKHFCTFVQFSPSTNLKTIVQFSKNLSDCSCTLRYLYRHLDKSFMSVTPHCYSNSSLYILTQEERICHFEKRLLQCDILPDEGITIYGTYYNVSHFYEQQISKRKSQLSNFFRYRLYYILILPVLIICICLIIRQQKNRHVDAYRHLHHLLKRRILTENENVPTSQALDIIYQQTSEVFDPISSRTYVTTQV
ncbi:unnamed protein product [Rotaria magnacalcarata]|uniref:Uncharacterized protein n=2 Tax=Rotaria magnacalcarata TaxID=392030 RepID=A0A816ESB2_9BILA|nr:unnamed protein product [Rotaria magnacalcarata]CAF3956259.1 unnamed protein product [Rotaria magnacalcarata]CAF4054445.1 unnamed protein product [Rotaria magnacalcarata]